jgi:hypothetical protein
MDSILGQVAMFSALILAVIELAKRVAEVVPGKKDDEIVGIVDGLVRHVLDWIAGRNLGQPGDPGLVKKD